MQVALLLTLAYSARAQMYRSVGPHGTVTFSGQPVPEAKPIDVRTLAPPSAGALAPVATAPEESGSSRQVLAPKPLAYDRFLITEPKDGEVVRANDGNVTISLALQPEIAPGHVIQLTVDGRPLPGKGASLIVTSPNMERGTHTVLATVLDARGQPIASTPSVIFHVLRVAGSPGSPPRG